MSKFLLSVYQPVGEPPAEVDLARIRSDLDALNDEMRLAQAWVFSDGLFPPDTATVIQVNGTEVTTTDGPYLESKEHLGGFTIVDAPDLDAAMAWARKLAKATTLPIEVRQFAGNHE